MKHRLSYRLPVGRLDQRLPDGQAVGRDHAGVEFKLERLAGLRDRLAVWKPLASPGPCRALCPPGARLPHRLRDVNESTAGRLSGMKVALVILVALALTGCGGHKTATPTQVARAWSAALDRNDNEAAGLLFADGAQIVQDST